MPAILRNRFVVVFLVLAIGIGAWNIYVSRHAHGIVDGTVVDSTGKPLAGATVTMYERDFVNQRERGHTTTDADGRFHFDDNVSHLVQLQARTGDAQSPRVTVRLWFRSQDTVLDSPLRIGGPA